MADKKAQNMELEILEDLRNSLQKFREDNESYHVMIAAQRCLETRNIQTLTTVLLDTENKTAALSCTLQLPRPVLAVQFLSETLLVAGGEFEGIRIFDIEKEDCIQTIPGHESRIKALEVVDDTFTHEDNKRLLLFSLSSDGDLRAWSLNQENLKEEAQLVARYEMNARPTCLTVSCPIKRKQPKSVENKSEEKETKQKREKLQRNNDKSERTTRQSGEEPTKKKVKKKKKSSIKKKKQQEEKEEAAAKTNEEVSEVLSPDDEDEEDEMEN